MPTALHIMNFVPKKRGTLEKFLIRFSRACSEEGLQSVFLFSGKPVDWFLAEIEPFALVQWVEGNPVADHFCVTLRRAWTVRPDVMSFWFVSLFSPKSLILTRLARGGRSIYIDGTSRDIPNRHGPARVLARVRGALGGRLYWKILSVSEHNRRRNVERSFIPHHRTLVVSNGIDVEELNPPGERAGANNCFLYVGQLSRDKGVFTLLAAYRDLLQRHGGPVPELWLAGDGPEIAAIRKQIAEHDMESHVTLLGLRDDVPELMKGAKAVVMPSEWPEAFGLVAAEAMAAGTPVIVSDAGALPEIVGETGLIVPKGDKVALRDALTEVLAETGRAAERAHLARLRCEELFDIKRMVAQYTALFRNAVREDQADD